MSNSKDSPINKTRNIVLIASIILIAVLLILAAQWSRNSRDNPSQEEISQQIADLAAATDAPESKDAAAGTAPAEEQTEARKTAEAYVYIIVNGRISGIYAVGEEGDVTVDQGNGKVNVIHVTDRGFYMASSTCDNQLCVQQGEVTVDNYQQRILGASVLCLPNNVDLELVVPSHTPDPNAPDI